MRKIIIVPVEPPPLTVSGGVFKACDESDLIDEGNQGDEGVSGSLHPAIAPAAALIIVVGGIYYLVNLPKAKRLRADLEETINEWYSSDRIWIPTRVLAREAAYQIASANSYEAVVSEKMYSPPSLKKREITFFMENWYRPLRGWYNQNFAALELEECKRQGVDAVLEIGIINYEIDAQGSFILQVFIKLCSVATRRVEGRAKSIVFLKVGCPQEIFKNQAETFKKIFEEEGGKLLKQDLIQVGLLPAGS